MALPAGRYGVTKNQLLKIKKLPMNTIKLIEELTEKFDLLGTAAFKNSTSVVTQSTDLVESGAVKDIVGWGNKNLFNPSIVNWSNYTYADGIAKNNITDTRDVFLLQIQGKKNNSFVKELITSLPITAVGNYEVEFTIGSSDDINRLHIGHNGGTNNIMFIYPFDLKGTYKLSFKATGVNPTVVNGIVLTDIMISANGGAYEPYHASVSDSLEEKCDNSVIGTVEDGTTASQAYAVREHFIRNGKFCTVTQAISSGGTLTEGTNYTSGDVTDELDVVDITNDYFSSALPTNVTMRPYSKIFKIGRVIIGNVVLYKSDGFASSSIEISVNSNYKALSAVNSFSYMGDSEWQSPTDYDISYLYIDDRVILRNLNSNQNPTYAKFNFVYVI